MGRGGLEARHVLKKWGSRASNVAQQVGTFCQVRQPEFEPRTHSVKESQLSTSHAQKRISYYILKRLSQSHRGMDPCFSYHTGQGFFRVRV